MDRSTAILQKSKLRKTKIRTSVLDLLSNREKALSRQDLERELGKVDRITLYRTLKAFVDHGIIHEAIDGTSETKYALCPEHCSSSGHQHDHAHFHCQSCDKTVCLDEVHTPSVKVPKGFQIQDIDVILQGTCDDCSL